MDRLILMRHGKAEAAIAGGEDFGRRLADRGAREAAAMARTLAGRGFIPELALVSSARRTRETWAAVQPAFPDTEVRIERGLYLAEAEDIWTSATLEAAGAILIIGHNPGLHELVLRLLWEAGSPAGPTAEAHRGYPTTAAIVFAFNAAGRPACEGLFLPPKADAVTRIYKILPRAEWTAAQQSGLFGGSGIDLQDGYIHFSTAAQAQETARRYFTGRGDLVVLEIEADGLGEDLRWEPSRGGDLFPHLYAPLPVTAVLAVHAAPLARDGVPQLGGLA
jgi:phosphohistidine phosphatase